MPTTDNPIPRPLPVGVNAKGLPLWDGTDLALFRVAYRETQYTVARRMGVSQPSVSAIWESSRMPLARSYRDAEKYFEAVEALSAKRDREAAEALKTLTDIVRKRSKRTKR